MVNRQHSGLPSWLCFHFCDKTPWPKATYRRKSLLWLMIPEETSIRAGKGMAAGWNSCPDTSSYTGSRESSLEVGQTCKFPKPTQHPWMDFLQHGPASQKSYNPLKQCHQLGSKCSNIWIYREHFSFRPLHLPSMLTVDTCQFINTHLKFTLVPSNSL